MRGLAGVRQIHFHCIAWIPTPQKAIRMVLAEPPITKNGRPCTFQMPFAHGGVRRCHVAEILMLLLNSLRFRA